MLLESPLVPPPLALPLPVPSKKHSARNGSGNGSGKGRGGGEGKEWENRALPSLRKKPRPSLFPLPAKKMGRKTAGSGGVSEGSEVNGARAWACRFPSPFSHWFPLPFPSLSFRAEKRREGSCGASASVDTAACT